MSVISDLKSVIKTRINNLGLAQAIYTYDEDHPSGWPAVFINSSDLEAEFVTTTENRRTFVFKIMAAFPLGQNLPKDSSKQPVEYAEDVLYNLFDAVAKDVDQNSWQSTFADLSDTYSEFLFIEATEAEWGYFNYEGGICRAINITLRIQVDFTAKTS